MQRGWPMQRRDFVAAGVCIAALPVTARPQVAKLQRIGWLDYSSAAENLGIFVQALAALGWIEGRTFRMEYRGGEGKPERLAAVAAELARMPVDVIVAPGNAEALAARTVTDSIPVVMTDVDDPVERGLVVTLARPGRNFTGLANAGRELNEKLLSLLREMVPRASKVAVLSDATEAGHRVVLRELQLAATKLGVVLNPVAVRRYEEVEPMIAATRKEGSQVLIVLPSSMLIPRWIADLALKNGLPLASTAAGYAYEGGLLAYADDWNAVFARAATFVDRILKGAKPADLPVELPTKFRLIVNAKTAQTLGLAIPPSISIRADSIIES